MTAIAAGSLHALALTSNGDVFAWGRNVVGALGDGTFTSSRTPVKVCAPGATAPCSTFLSNVVGIAAGADHSVALRSDGSVVAWGDNEAGQLGDGTFVTSSTPVQVCSPGSTFPCPGFLSGVSAVAAGNSHSFALNADGTVLAWGLNSAGQLGNGGGASLNPRPVSVCAPGTTAPCSNVLSGVTRLSGGEFHSVAVKTDGTVWAWGRNLDGQLGDGTSVIRTTPVQVCAPGETAPCSKFLSGVNVIDAGERYTLAISAPTPTTGTIIVEKQTSPDGATGPDGAAASFTFSGDATGTISDNGQITVANLAPGNYTSTENIPAAQGFILTAVTCDDANSTGDVASRTATFNLSAGETIKCTFTNTKGGRISFVKDTVPDDAQDFTFTGTAFNGSVILDDDDNNTRSNTSDTFLRVPGTYTITEAAQTGWDVTLIHCEEGTSNTSVNLGTRTATINLTAGDSVLCTFENNKQTTGTGTIIVEKQTNPDGATGSFTFSGDAAGTISDNGTIIVPNLAPGTYTSTEALPTAQLFVLQSIACDDGNSSGNFSTRTATFNLEAGETVKCTFTNLKGGGIRFVKDAVPDDPQDFIFSGAAIATLDDDPTDPTRSNTSPLFVRGAGTHTVAESAVAGWDVSSITCDDSDSTGDPSTRTATYRLVAGETITCTFVNTRQVHTLTVTSAGSGMVTSSPAGIDCGSDCSEAYAHGSEIILTATPASGFTFAGWSGACTNATGTCTVTMDADKSVTASFVTAPLRKFTLTISKQGSGDGTVSGSNVDCGSICSPGFAEGTVVELTATPDAGSNFAGWSGACTNTTGTCTVTMDEDKAVTATFNLVPVSTGTIRIVKDSVPNDPQDFGFRASAGLSPSEFTLDDDPNSTTPSIQEFLSVPVGTGYTVSEGAFAIPVGTLAWDLAIRCDDADSSVSPTSRSATINLAADETVTCTFTNTRRGGAEVNKTVSGQTPGAGQVFTFQVRSGSTPTELGQTLVSTPTSAAGNARLTGNGGLQPGAYQLCEADMLPGWTSSLSSLAGAFVPNADDPFHDNGVICVPFTVAAGVVQTFAVDNTPPPGGDARNIGYWKNHSSCTGGKQTAVLNTTLASFAGGGVLIGDLFVDQCLEAVRILSKSTVDSGKKMASDAAYSLAAQLLAARLNIQAAAGSCAGVDTAIADGQGLLDTINFTGKGGYLDSKAKGERAAQRTRATNLAKTLNDYNDNLLCP